MAVIMSEKHMSAISPVTAIIAVTLNCNSRCVMCDIWKNRRPHELAPEHYLKLPASLTDINITGGEPFLRRDIVQIIDNMRRAAPRARFVLNTNGFMVHRIKTTMKQIYEIDPKFGFRVSIDGIGKRHDEIRRIRGGYDKITRALAEVRRIGFRDLGISFTLGYYNMDELPKVQHLAAREGLEFSLTVTTGSVIYFGEDKSSYRPKDTGKVTSLLTAAARRHYARMTPKEIVRGWFTTRLLEHINTGKRALPCDAGQGFFYLDSVGNVFACHIKPWIMGDITKQSFSEIMKNQVHAEKVSNCNGCWMVCTAKSMMKSRLYKVASEALREKVTAAFAQSVSS